CYSRPTLQLRMRSGDHYELFEKTEKPLVECWISRGKSIVSDSYLRPQRRSTGTIDRVAERLIPRHPPRLTPPPSSRQSTIVRSMRICTASLLSYSGTSMSMVPYNTTPMLESLLA